MRSSHIDFRIYGRGIYCKFFSFGIASLLIVLAGISPSVVSAQVQAIGELSFIVPKGWKYENKPGSPVGAVCLATAVTTACS